jgi:hypothetical protein
MAAVIRQINFFVIYMKTPSPSKVMADRREFDRPKMQSSRNFDLRKHVGLRADRQARLPPDISASESFAA